MAFPADLTNAVDGVTEIVAAHLNNLEAKVGIDNSTAPGSLDYLLKSAGSIEPGHKHGKLWQPDGGIAAVVVDAAGNVGIGTSNPQGPLEIYNPAYANTVALFTDYAYLRFRNPFSGAWGDMLRMSFANPDELVLGETSSLGAVQIRSWGDIKFFTFPDGGITQIVTFQRAGNVGIGITGFGNSAAKVLGLGSGTAPTTAPGDMFQMWCQDIGPGHGAPHFMTELGKIIRLYQQGHLADPAAEVAALAGWAASINTFLENLGLMATS